jgi:predicted MPP superfamily phosphohydrolase
VGSGASAVRRPGAGAFVGAALVGALAWGWFEAGWVRRRSIELHIRALPRELAGIRIVHLSDFHLGLPSRGSRAVARAIEWTIEREPDLVVVTGDLVSRPGGEARLRELLAPVGRAYAVLGNHDVEHSRDPFSRSAGLTDLSPARLLVDEAEVVEVRGRRVQLVGVDPRAYRTGRSKPWRLADRSADLRILLCHFPSVLRRLPDDSFQLVLAGHMHDGQITVPLPRGKLRLAHPRAAFAAGVYARDGVQMHVSPGLGTTFVPFRFYARPEATELLLQPA